MSDGLRAEGVTVRRGRSDVVRDASLTVAAGEIVALLGPNGAGKSTLLAGLAGRLPVRGAVERPARTASVLQSPGLADRTVAANVMLALAWSGVPRTQRRRRAGQALRRMRVDHLARVRARELSGGEQRRVHLARAIAVQPELMLLDEPFDGLDPATHTELRDDMVDALRESGAAVVVVLHDRRDAWAMADRVMVLIDGTIRAEGPPQSVLEAPPSADVARFLGYDGELRAGDELVLTRPGHVVVGDGEFEGVVRRVTVEEDGALVRLGTAAGDVRARVPGRPPAIGDVLRFAVAGAPRFPAGAPDQAGGA